jgi:hypothetical protein
MSTGTTAGGLLLGYARVIALGQDEALQQDALHAAGSRRLLVDKVSVRLEHRPALMSFWTTPAPTTCR